MIYFYNVILKFIWHWGCEDTVLWTDEYWTCMCRQYTTTIYHHSGTAYFSPKHFRSKPRYFSVTPRWTISMSLAYYINLSSQEQNDHCRLGTLFITFPKAQFFVDYFIIIHYEHTQLFWVRLGDFNFRHTKM